MDYIYGTISQKAEKINYKGTTSDSAVVTVAGQSISAKVIRDVPTWNRVEDLNKVLTVTENGDIKWQTCLTGTFDFEELNNRPKYNGTAMDRNTSIPEINAIAWNGAVSSLHGHQVYKDVPSNAVFTDTRPLYAGSPVEDTTSIPEVKATAWDAKTTVSASTTGTATDKINFLTIDGEEKKIGVEGYTLNSIDYDPNLNIIILNGNKYLLTPYSPS